MMQFSSSAVLGLCAFGVNPSALLLGFGAIAMTLIACIFVIPALVYFIVGWTKLIIRAVRESRYTKVHGNFAWFSPKFLISDKKNMIHWLRQ